MKKIILYGCLVMSFYVTAQVGINTTSPDPSSSLEISGSNTGFLMTRVALTAKNVASPVTSPANGLLVFNTATAGSVPNDVSPGFYWWDNSSTKWIRMSDEKKGKSYSNEFIQSSELNPDFTSGTFETIPNLNNSFTAPFTGYYEFVFNGIYAINSPAGGNMKEASQNLYKDMGFGEGVFKLTVNGTDYFSKANAESYKVSFINDNIAHNTSPGFSVNLSRVGSYVTITKRVFLNAGTLCSFTASFDELFQLDTFALSSSPYTQLKSYVGRLAITPSVPCNLNITYVGE